MYYAKVDQFDDSTSTSCVRPALSRSEFINIFAKDLEDHLTLKPTVKSSRDTVTCKGNERNFHRIMRRGRITALNAKYEAQ